MAGFVKAMRSDEAAFLDTNPLANHVLNVIARRARRTPCLLTGLQIGECFVGHKGLGLSEQQYRTVKKNLTKWGFVEFKKAGRVTDRGTVAKLLNSDVYDINEADPNGRPTEDQRKGNGRATEDQRQTKNVISEESKNETITKEKSKRFVPPTQQDVFDYMIEKEVEQEKARSESERFTDYYESNGWKVGKNKMKSWKASVRNWMKGFSNETRQRPNQQPAINHDSTDWGDEVFDRVQGTIQASDQRIIPPTTGNLLSLETSVPGSGGAECDQAGVVKSVHDRWDQ